MAEKIRVGMVDFRCLEVSPPHEAFGLFTLNDDSKPWRNSRR